MRFVKRVWTSGAALRLPPSLGSRALRNGYVKLNSRKLVSTLQFLEYAIEVASREHTGYCRRVVFQNAYNVECEGARRMSPHFTSLICNSIGLCNARAVPHSISWTTWFVLFRGLLILRNVIVVRRIIFSPHEFLFKITEGDRLVRLEASWRRV